MIRIPRFNKQVLQSPQKYWYPVVLNVVYVALNSENATEAENQMSDIGLVTALLPMCQLKITVFFFIYDI